MCWGSCTARRIGIAKGRYVGAEPPRSPTIPGMRYRVPATSYTPTTVPRRFRSRGISARCRSAFRPLRRPKEVAGLWRSEPAVVRCMVKHVRVGVQWRQSRAVMCSPYPQCQPVPIAATRRSGGSDLPAVNPERTLKTRVVFATLTPPGSNPPNPKCFGIKHLGFFVFTHTCFPARNRRCCPPKVLSFPPEANPKTDSGGRSPVPSVYTVDAVSLAGSTVR